MRVNQQFVLPRTLSRERMIERIGRVLAGLSMDNAWNITIAEHKPTRSHAQNRYLWGIVYPTILKAGALEGWEADDLHEYLLGECFGWETLAGFGKRRLRPLRRSSKLNKQEFSDYVAFIQRKMAEHGVYVPDPNEMDDVACLS